MDNHRLNNLLKTQFIGISVIFLGLTSCIKYSARLVLVCMASLGGHLPCFGCYFCWHFHLFFNYRLIFKVQKPHHMFFVPLLILDSDPFMDLLLMQLERSSSLWSIFSKSTMLFFYFFILYFERVSLIIIHNLLFL